METFQMESCVRGYHIYQELWEAVNVCSPVKIFRAFNIRHLGNRRKFFNGENFPIYGNQYDHSKNDRDANFYLCTFNMFGSVHF